MFGFIADWLRRKARDKQRFIFRYWNGSKTVFGDPLELHRNLQAHPDYTEDSFSLITREELRNDIIGELAAVVREVFSIPKLIDGGLTELECVQLLAEFIEYAGVQKKSGEQTPTLPTATEESLESSVQQKNTNDDSAST